MQSWMTPSTWVTTANTRTRPAVDTILVGSSLGPKGITTVTILLLDREHSLDWTGDLHSSRPRHTGYTADLDRDNTNT
ncbi:hypothetical protein J6590_045650 [Homalodisca vitripennis]|nr:hypothetical protein J6590_045650 [Homalodisca vitripennis]